MPVIYIIAVCHYFVYYNMARYTLIKTVRKPEAMNDDLILGYISWMKWAPILYIFNAYNYLSNK